MCRMDSGIEFSFYTAGKQGAQRGIRVCFFIKNGVNRVTNRKFHSIARPQFHQGAHSGHAFGKASVRLTFDIACLLYTSPSPRDS